MKLTYFGHSCFGIEINGLHLVFDPFISGNPLAAHIDLKQVNADYILISHGHEDHVLDAEIIAKRTGAKLISNFEIINWFQSKGLENGHSMNHGGKFSFDFGTVQYVNAVHSSSMPDGSYGGNPGGFVITPKGSRSSFYYAGDTALTYDMKLIGEQETIDFALLPIGDNYTMGVDDAIRAAEFVGTSKIVGLHYNTFPPIQIETEKAVARFSETGKTLLLPQIGDTIDF
ncbi:MAG: metal-dependent hydrolase [Alphaproteobacteria bacterium]|jgi:L-ascorbate metabolism protein UlaG (beta-lactamase superfamily)|nr:metal-dependent hydrolase [Alphaproteobacteria bacterium]